MSRVVREIRNRVIRQGGERHSGWLPEGAAHPRPTSVREVTVDFSVSQEGPASFILRWEGPDRDTTGDTWHPDLEAALEQAAIMFGVHPDEWSSR